MFPGKIFSLAKENKIFLVLSKKLEKESKFFI